MEPVFRPSCRLLHALPTLIARSFRNFKAAARFIRLKPQITGFGSQRMCLSCGLITSHSKAFCLECGKPFELGEKMRRNNTVIIVRIVFALLVLYTIFGFIWLIRKTVSTSVVLERWRYTTGVVVCDSSGYFSVLKPQHFASIRKREEAS
jgi:predicted nucleic acid-binding Zn ribbon protein